MQDNLLSTSQSTRTKYPIFFCKIIGRLTSPTKPTKRNPKGGTKERTFSITTPLKFDNKGITPLNNRSFELQDKYAVKDSETVIFDEVEKLRYMTFTYIKE
jgi:hypothetical protein